MGSSSSGEGRLTTFQRELLHAFFQRAEGFFLTGGAVLVEYHLKHRTTDDLDLFTSEDLLDEGVQALLAAAEAIDAECQAIRTSPDFRRFLVKREQAAAVIDLVRDRVPQLREKVELGTIVVDDIAEIAANKLCALVGRAEIRDLVDVMLLERAGHRVEDGLIEAHAKDGGVTPATLAWVLSQLAVAEDAELPGGVPVEELRRFVDDVQRRLRALAFPGA
jgi:Nucleotidyl transferase AbiEii toxin, Type IV TA system